MRAIFILFTLIGFFTVICESGSASTLNCYKSWPLTSPLGSVPGITSSTAHTLFAELCESHVPSCGKNCFGELK